MNISQIKSVRGYILVWTLLLMVLLSFISAYLYDAYTQQITFERNYIQTMAHQRLMRQLLSRCEQKLQLRFQSIIAATYISQELSLSQGAQQQQALFNIESLDDVHRAIYSTTLLKQLFLNFEPVPSIGAETDQALWSCAYFKVQSYPLTALLTQQQSDQLAAQIAYNYMLNSAVYWVYVYAFMVEQKDAKQMVLRSNFILLDQSLSELNPVVKAITQRRASSYFERIE